MDLSDDDANRPAARADEHHEERDRGESVPQSPQTSTGAAQLVSGHDDEGEPRRLRSEERRVGKEWSERRREVRCKQKTAYEIRDVTGVQTCALPISAAGAVTYGLVRRRRQPPGRPRR